MLVINFSIGVEEKRADEMQNKLIEDYGIEIKKRYTCYEQALSGDERIPRVYFDCYAPMTRLKFLTEYLNGDYKDVAILSY